MLYHIALEMIFVNLILFRFHALVGTYHRHHLHEHPNHWCWPVCRLLCAHCSRLHNWTRQTARESRLCHGEYSASSFKWRIFFNSCPVIVGYLEVTRVCVIFQDFLYDLHVWTLPWPYSAASCAVFNRYLFPLIITKWHCSSL